MSRKGLIRICIVGGQAYQLRNSAQCGLECQLHLAWNVLPPNDVCFQGGYGRNVAKRKTAEHIYCTKIHLLWDSVGKLTVSIKMIHPLEVACICMQQCVIFVKWIMFLMWLKWLYGTHD